MSVIKKIQENERKFLSILGLKLPYDTEQDSVTRYVTIGSLRLPYHFTAKRHIPLPFPQSPRSIRSAGVDCQKAARYQIREMWNDPTAVQKQLEELYEQRTGRKPDLENPVRFTEKINRMKLTYHDSLITVCCDKYALKDYVDTILGENHRVPTLAAWSKAEDVDFDKLPASSVLKVNWSSGYNLFIRDKDKLSDREKDRILAQIEVWLRPEANSYYDSFNWGYKDIPPVVYAEPFLSPQSTAQEYKVFCFHGKPQFTLMELNLPDGKEQRAIIDNNGEKLPFTFGAQSVSDHYLVPEDLGVMLSMAEKLSEPFPFVRVDFLGTPQRRLVGEMTFYSGGGFSAISPADWDEKLGALLDLSAVESQDK